MPRWLRVVRGMIGTGLAFAVAVGTMSALVVLIAVLAGEGVLREMAGMAGRLSVVAFLVGVVFSGVLASSARGRQFGKLSLGFVTFLGACGGLIYFLLIGVNNGFRVWSLANAIGNFAILTLMGGGLAAGSLILARKAGHSLKSGDEPRSLGEGSVEEALAQREIEKASRR